MSAHQLVGAVGPVLDEETDDAAPGPVGTPAGSSVWRRGWKRHVTDVRVTVDAESDAYRSKVSARTADARMIVVLVTVAVCLTLNNFLASGRNPAWLVSLLDYVGLDSLSSRLDAAMVSEHAAFNQLVFWAVVQIAGYVVIPLVVIVFVFKERVRDFGLRARGVFRHGGVYALLFACALPGLVAASYTGAFQARYPFYDLRPGEGYWPHLWVWWALYAAQFVALEFFFRGFLLHGAKARFGWAAVLVMVVPYNMLHYGKPMPEALAAIAGGVVLGTLSLETRSIWWGAALHITIAATMDVLSLWHQGLAF